MPENSPTTGAADASNAAPVGPSASAPSMNTVDTAARGQDPTDAGANVAAAFEDTDESAAARAPNQDFQRILSIEVPVIVQLAHRRLKLSEVMRLSTGAIIEFTKSADDDLDLLANNKTIGKGLAVKVGENFGVKISAMGTAQETIQKLGQ